MREGTQDARQGREKGTEKWVTRTGIFKEAMGARHQRGRGLSYRPARLHRLAEFIPWNRFRGPIHTFKNASSEEKL
jgi:hypothetical protein